METPASNRGPDEGFRWLELEESDFWHLMRKHRRVLVWVPVIGVIVSLVYCFLATPLYTTSSLLYLRPNFDKDLQVEQVFSKLEDDDSLRSIEKAVVSDTVLLRMIERLDLREDPAYLMVDERKMEPLSDSQLLKKVSKRYRAELLPTTRMLKLSVTDPSAERARVIAKTLVEEFLSLLREELNKEEKLLRETLAVQAGEALQEAMKSETALEEFRMLHPDFLVEQDSNVFQERVLQHGRELNDAKTNSARLKGMVEALLQIEPEKSPMQIFEILGTRNNEYVSELLKLHTAAEAKLAAAKQIYGIKNPEYRMAEEALQQMQRSLRTYAGELKQSAMADYNASLCKADQLHASLQGIQGEFVNFKTKSAQFRALKTEVDKNWNVHSELQEKLLNLTLNPEVSPMVTIPLSEPVVPHRPSHPSKRLIAGGALLLSLLLVFGYVLLANRGGLPFTSASQLQAVLRGPVIGVFDLPETAAKEDLERRLVPEGRLFGLPVALGSSRLVHFASLDEEAHLSSLPAALSNVFFQSGYSTLLITVQESVPVSALPLDAPDFKSVSLLSSAEWKKPAKPSLAEPRKFELPLAALVHREQFRRFLEGLGTDFDRVVFDTTGVREREAILAVAKEMESNVLLVAEERVRRREVESFLGRMREEGAKSVAGVYVRFRPTGTPRVPPPVETVELRRANRWTWFPNRLRSGRSLEDKELKKAG